VCEVQLGVDVTLISSEIGEQVLVYHAQRSYYEQLLRAGVKIYLYQSPILLHSKRRSVDDDIAVIGSSNMELRPSRSTSRCFCSAMTEASSPPCSRSSLAFWGARSHSISKNGLPAPR
jgi:PLD-like domain